MRHSEKSEQHLTKFYKICLLQLQPRWHTCAEIHKKEVQNSWTLANIQNDVPTILWNLRNATKLAFSCKHRRRYSLEQAPERSEEDRAIPKAPMVIRNFTAQTSKALYRKRGRDKESSWSKNRLLFYLLSTDEGAACGNLQPCGALSMIGFICSGLRRRSSLLYLLARSTLWGEWEIKIWPYYLLFSDDFEKFRMIFLQIWQQILQMMISYDLHISP